MRITKAQSLTTLGNGTDWYTRTQVHEYTGTLVHVHIAQSIVKELSCVYMYVSTFARSPKLVKELTPAYNINKQIA